MLRNLSGLNSDDIDEDTRDVEPTSFEDYTHQRQNEYNKILKEVKENWLKSENTNRRLKKWYGYGGFNSDKKNMGSDVER